MLRLFHALTAGLLFAFCTNVHAVLIDFDNLPNGGTTIAGQSLSVEYASLGVIFSGFENGASASNTIGNDLSILNPMGNALSNSSPFSGGSRNDILRIAFDTPVMNLSWLTRRSFEAPTFFFYDASDNLLGSLTSETSAVNCCSLVSTVAPFSGVSRIDAIQPSDRWFWTMDNLSFEVGTVPAPATLTLFIAALAGLTWSMRSRHHAAPKHTDALQGAPCS